MYKFTRGLAVLTLVSTLMTSTIIGCVAPRKPELPSPAPSPRTTPAPDTARKPSINPTQQSRKAVKQAESVSGVVKATAASTGATMFVGISLKGSPATVRVDGIKRDVANRVKRNDRSITSVLVTADPKLMRRIKDIANSISKGKPVSAFNRDFIELSRSIMPTQR